MMPGSPPFVDRESGALDIRQIWTEAFPLLGLILLFGALAMIPLLFVFAIGGGSYLGAFFTLLAQLVLAVGTGIVLIYVVTRGIQLAEERS